MYNRVDVADAEAYDEPQDPNGYLGQTKFYRTHTKQVAIAEDEFIAVIYHENKLESMMITIKQIDKDIQPFQVLNRKLASIFSQIKISKGAKSNNGGSLITRVQVLHQLLDLPIFGR